MRRVKDIGEFGLIQRLSKNIKVDKSVICGIGDDAAVMELAKDNYLVVTCDMLIEGRHFSKDAQPVAIGHKALAVSLSDIAAMGAIAKYAFVSLGVPRNTTVSFIDRVYKGIINLAGKFNLSICGGDTNASDKLTIDITIIGVTDKKRLALRDGAKDGDFIFITGRLGGSLKSGRHLRFVPRLSESGYLVNNFKLNSMIDISDGLVADLGHIITKSKVGAVVYEELIPKNKYAKSLGDALYSGEDFELLFTAPQEEAKKLIKAKHPKGMNFFLIGQIIKKHKAILLVDKKRKASELKIKGFRHF